MEKEDLEKFKKLTLEEHQFYSRRYEQVSLIISGFGLYACLEFARILLEKKQDSNILIYSTICFSTSIVLALITLRLEKKIRQHYLLLLFQVEGNVLSEDENKEKKSAEKSRKLENISTFLDSLNLVITSGAIILLIISAYNIFIF